MTLLLALDAGTTSVKAGLFQPDGRCLASALHEYTLLSGSADEAELDPTTYWQAACQTIRSVLTQASADPGEVAAMAVSSQGETTIALDNAGRPLRNALVWLDNRAVRQADELKELLGSGVYDHTGDPEVIPTWTACKILWIKQNEPELFKKADKFLLVQDYLIYRLTGQYVTDGSVTCTSLLYDIVEHCWWEKCLQAIGITADRLARVQQPGSVAGRLTEIAAAELGLTTRTMVVCGGMDQSVGAIGAGNIRPGIITETTGAALTVQASIPNPAVDKNKKTPVYEHSIAGEYLFVPVCPTAGMAFKWYKDQFGEAEITRAEKEGRSVYDLLTETAAGAPVGCDGLVLLPHLMGAYSPDINPSARGVFCGFTLHHTRAHFVRAVLEGVACLLRRNLELIETSGFTIREVRSTGGGSRSRLWNQIKADVCGVPILLLENEDTALVGDAILAGVACGGFKTVAEGVDAMVRIKETIYPGPDMEVYQATYRRYCDLDTTLTGYFTRNT
ncbi:MAG: FGGY-family carbohydrate kinase [Anaerolineaceae bacterium]